MNKNDAIEQAQKIFPKGRFCKELSRKNWQQEAVKAINKLAQSLRQFRFVTRRRRDLLIIQFALRGDLREVIQEDPTGETREEEAFDEVISGHVELRYWHRYGDLLNELRKELGQVPGVEDESELFFGPKGSRAFQCDWPVLDICHGGMSYGPFLNRISKRDLRRTATEAILEEMYACGLIGRCGRNGPFMTLEGERI
jgi:hypothetical protein